MKNNFFRNLIERHNKNTALIWVSGFTLVELMVVISIFIVITAVAIFNYGDFNSNVSLQNLTDDVALSIRKAQGFAIGARGINKGVNQEFNNSYGMHFSIDPNNADLDGSNKAFLMFSIPVGNSKQYNNTTGSCGGVNDSCIELFNINSADEIKGIVIDGSPTTQGSIDIVFTRPNTRAAFCYRASMGSPCDNNASRVGIIISNGQTEVGKEKTKTISIQNTGQISIQ